MGYRVDDTGHFQINEERAEVVCWIFSGKIPRLRQLIEGLPARERKLILLRYGLAGQPPLTQLETVKLLQISRSYVSRLETHALALLREGWKQKTAQKE